MMQTATGELQIDDALARRNAYVLATAQAFGGASAPIVIGIGGLAGWYLLGEDKSLATLPVTTFVLGVASGAIPAAFLMQRIGRMLGFQIGAVSTMTGGALAAYALLTSQFWLLCFGTVFSGIGNAFVHQYRFAAADTASAGLRPKVISWVLAGGVVTGIVGPQVVIFSKDLLSPIPFAGAFLAQVALGLITIVVLSFLRAPPPVQQVAGSNGRPVGEIARQPRFVVAVVCGTVTYALMSLVMTASPLAMIECDLTETQAMLGIQWHVIAMFAPSFFTGALIARYGKESVIAAGLALLVACAVVALSGITLAHFWIALILLGVGWNFGFIGATAMVADTYRSEERGKMQATNDFLIFAFQAIASLSSGAMLAAGGWEAVNLIVFPFAALAMALLVWLWMADRRQAAA